MNYHNQPAIAGWSAGKRTTRGAAPRALGGAVAWWRPAGDGRDGSWYLAELVVVDSWGWSAGLWLAYWLVYEAYLMVSELVQRLVNDGELMH